MSRRHTARVFCGVAAALTLCGAARAAENDAPGAPAAGTLTVDVAHPGARVSPNLFGIFFEEINHAGDGGLYGELIRNRSFEDSAAAPDGWSLVTGDSGGAATMRLDDAHGLNATNAHVLRLDITDAGKNGVGVANAGYWGVPVTKGRRYRFSLYTRSDAGSYPGAVRASLESADEKTRYAERILSGGVGGEWRRFAGELTAEGDDPTARLVIRATAPGTLYLDMVSLFPVDTFRKRENGLRPDLANMVAALKPAFIRFPGGCFVEGDRMANAFRWKETVGDIAGRPGHSNLWGYRSTDGLGFHEYLQMCEDMNAEPLFVVNVGMAHKDTVPMDRLDPWIQDALDALEYANGDKTTKWGALRAANGHPAPFRLRTIEIGNENGGKEYAERYARFYSAIKAQYPDSVLIADEWRGLPRGVPIDVYDHHIYTSPEALAAQAHDFDSLDRKGPRVYVGEYAVTRNAGQGNLAAALGEAAYMTGLERNGDVVMMASYAPLFVNVRDRKWNPDAIVYDAARAYGTPSYYVQRLFRANQISRVLPLTISVPSDPSAAALAERSGAVGVGTWRTQAEYRDIKVTGPGGEILLDGAAKNDAPLPGWRVVRGDWSRTAGAEGVLKQASEAEDVRSVFGSPDWKDYTVSLKARKTAGAEGFLVLFRARDDSNWYWWNVGGWANTRCAVEKSVGDSKAEIGRSVNGHIETGRWYDLRVEVRGDRIRCYLDNKLVNDVRETVSEPVYAVAGVDDAHNGDLVLKVVNTRATASSLNVSLANATGLSGQGTATVLTGPGPSAENSLDTPLNIYPMTQPITSLGATFTYTFAPNSLTILRLKAK